MSTHNMFLLRNKKDIRLFRMKKSALSVAMLLTLNISLRTETVIHRQQQGTVWLVTTCRL